MIEWRIMEKYRLCKYLQQKEAEIYEKTKQEI